MVGWPKKVYFQGIKEHLTMKSVLGDEGARDEDLKFIRKSKPSDKNIEKDVGCF